MGKPKPKQEIEESEDEREDTPDFSLFGKQFKSVVSPKRIFLWIFLFTSQDTVFRIMCEFVNIPIDFIIGKSLKNRKFPSRKSNWLFLSCWHFNFSTQRSTSFWGFKSVSSIAHSRMRCVYLPLNQSSRPLVFLVIDPDILIFFYCVTLHCSS